MNKLSILIFIGLNLIHCCIPSFGQADKKDDVIEKATPRMSLVSTQINGDTILLEASIKVKREGSWQPVDYEWVKFSLQMDSTTKQLGKALASDNGIASLKVGKTQLLKGEDGFWNFGAVFDGNEKVEEGEAELSIKEVGIVLSGEKQDTSYSVTLKLFVPGTESEPIADTEVGFYVKRHFSNLKIGEGTTDENGEVTVECPWDLRANIQGNIILIGKVEDLEEYGSAVAYMEKQWGVPIEKSNDRIERSLSGHLPPLWMVITFAILMSTVWGHYFVIIYKLVKLRKLKLQNP